MYFYILLKRGKVNLTDVYNASVNYDIPNTHKNNLHMVLYKMDWLTLRLITQHLARRHPEKTNDLSQVTDKLYYICCIEYTSPWMGFEFTALVVIGTDCIGSCKSNYHTITPRRPLVKHWWDDVLYQIVNSESNVNRQLVQCLKFNVWCI